MTSALLAGLLSIVTAGCGPRDGPAGAAESQTTLRVGFGLSNSTSSESGIRQVVQNILAEALVSLGDDGHSAPWLAQGWDESPDGLTWRFQLRPDVRFHDGTPLTASEVVTVLTNQLPRFMGRAFEDVESIRAVDDHEVEIVLHDRSTFLLEALSLPIVKAGSIGTGPFVLNDELNSTMKMRAFASYHSGKPTVDEIEIRPYSSIRSAWADLLRGEVDMLYEVGAETLDSLRESSQVSIHIAERAYAYVVIFNLKKPRLQGSAFRRGLSAAVDRHALVADGLDGLGTVADAPVWPRHWAYDPELPRFTFDPTPLDVSRTDGPLTLVFAEQAHERMVLMVQRQLHAVGVEVVPELAPIDEVMTKVMNGDFDLFFADAGLGPTLLRAGLFWRSGSLPFNVGGYSNHEVDAALDSIRRARDEQSYRTGVAAFQRAIVEDPPGIFLAWSQRARAVSTRFEVPVEPGRDILSTLRLWRPVVGRAGAGAPAAMREPRIGGSEARASAEAKRRGWAAFAEAPASVAEAARRPGPGATKE